MLKIGQLPIALPSAPLAQNRMLAAGNLKDTNVPMELRS